MTQRINCNFNEIAEILLNRNLSIEEIEPTDKKTNTKERIRQCIESEEFKQLHLGLCSYSISSDNRQGLWSEAQLDKNRDCSCYFLDYSLIMITKASGTVVRLSAPIHERNGTVRIFAQPNEGLDSFAESASTLDFREVMAGQVGHPIQLTLSTELISIEHRLNYLPMRNINPLPVYANIFKALLQRKLPEEEFYSYFRQKSLKNYLESIISAEEFFHKRIFEPLSRSCLCRVDKTQDFTLCMPSLSDYSIFTCLNLQASNAHFLLLIPMHINESFFLDQEIMSDPEIASTAIPFCEQSAYNLFFYMNRSSEILNELVNQIFPSSQCELAMLSRLQESYAIPVLETIFNQCQEVNITLVTPQWIELNLTLASNLQNNQVFLAVPS